MTPNTIQIDSVDDLKKFAIELVSKLGKKQVLSLEGPMGAGKTTFVNALVSAMGGASISSPTYSLHQSYKTSRGPVEHVDLYRLKNELDLDSTGFWDLFDAKAGLILVEWGDRLEVWPSTWNVIHLRFEVTGPTTRTIRVDWRPS